ncbi:MAG: hypothetical protein WA954_00555 [Parerythrobacter sp.]
MSFDNKPPAKARRPRRNTADRLRGAVIGMTGGLGKTVNQTERPWASITFSGERHRLELVFEGERAIAAGEALIAALPDHEFTLPRLLVADATIIAVESTLLPAPKLRVACEFLLLEEA